MPQTTGIEYRAATDFRADGDDGAMIIRGMAIVFDTPTVIGYMDGREIYEVIDRRAMENCDTQNCCLKYNHSHDNLILARTRGESLKMETLQEGVQFEARLFNTQFSRDVFELVRQDVLQCSFGFILEPNGAIYDPDTRTRRILRIKQLVDLSVVDVPAYKETFVEARSFCEAEIHKAAEVARRRELYTRLLI